MSLWVYKSPLVRLCFQFYNYSHYLSRCFWASTSQVTRRILNNATRCVIYSREKLHSGMERACVTQVGTLWMTWENRERDYWTKGDVGPFLASTQLLFTISGEHLKNTSSLFAFEYRLLKANETITFLCLQSGTVAAVSSKTSFLCTFYAVWKMKTTEQTSQTVCTSGGWSSCLKANREQENSTANDCGGKCCSSVIKAPSRWRWWMCRTPLKLLHLLAACLRAGAVSFDGWVVNLSMLHPKTELFFNHYYY